jgi:hypothetical protein
LCIFELFESLKLSKRGFKFVHILQHKSAFSKGSAF